MNNVSFKGNYYFKGDDTMGIASLKNRLSEIPNSKIVQDEKGTLLLTNEDKKERDAIFKATKAVYRESSDSEINQRINQAFAQKAIKIDVGELQQWPRVPKA